jgi:hypothetical protein
MEPVTVVGLGLLFAARGNRYYRYQRRGCQFKIAQMLAAKMLDEHERIMRKLNHRRVVCLQLTLGLDQKLIFLQGLF